MVESDSNYQLRDQLPQTDIELFRALKGRQPSALGVLYDRYGTLVYGLSLRVLKNSQEAEDLTQEGDKLILLFCRKFFCCREV